MSRGLLVVHPDADERHRIRTAAEGRGLGVRESASAAEALALVRKEMPLAAVMKLEPGELNSIELLKSLHELIGESICVLADSEKSAVTSQINTFLEKLDPLPPATSPGSCICSLP